MGQGFDTAPQIGVLEIFWTVARNWNKYRALFMQICKFWYFLFCLNKENSFKKKSHPVLNHSLYSDSSSKVKQKKNKNKKTAF